MTEAIIRKALSCIDREQWKPVRNGDKIRVKGERFMAEVTGLRSADGEPSYAVYDAEALASYLAAVSPENIAALLVEMDALRKAAGDYKLSEDIRHSLVKLAYRVNMDMLDKKEPAG